MYIAIDENGNVKRISEEQEQESDIFIPGIDIDFLVIDGKRARFNKHYGGSLVYMTQEEYNLYQTDWKVLRHLEQKELVNAGIRTTTDMSDADFRNLIIDRQAQRDNSNTRP